MSQVTAIVVVRNGERELAATLDALASQTRRPDALVVVDCASRDKSIDIAARIGPTHLVRSEHRLTFGDAIDAAVRILPPAGPDDALWLLPHDAAPEPGALAALLGELEVSPSVGVAGPKLLRADNSDYFVEYGESISTTGTTVALVHDELDQGQHDGLSDVLAVAPAGMLVRQRVWVELDGFDPGLPVVDDALDFCIRARLAGHRVSVTPKARVQFGGGGIAGASESEKWRKRITRARQMRTAQLHRRLAYTPGFWLFWHWLSLLPLAVVRSAWLLIMKAPGQIGGEFRAAFAVALGFGSVAYSRRLRKRTQTQRWSSIESLRVSPAEMRRRRALEREARIARVTGQRHEIQFFASGGGWTLVVAALVSLLLFVRILGAPAIVGGGLGLMSDSVLNLWQNAAYGWRDLSTGFIGAADPFMLVLATLGTLTFWSPSYALVLLWLLAIPAAAMTAWFAAARFSDRGGIRAFAALLWGLAPMLLAALADGRPGAVIAHILLPLLVLAMLGASRSWTAAAVAALLFAAVAASAPSLAPALLVGWLVVLIIAGRGTIKVLSIPLVTIVLFAPLAITQTLRGTPLGILADPGFPVVGTRSTSSLLLVGFPTATGWDTALGLIGIDWLSPSLLATVLVAPLIVLGLFALFMPGSRVAVVSLILAAAGLGTALATQQVQVATAGAERVYLWTGAGLSIYWLGLAGAAVIGMRALGRFGKPFTTISTVAVVALVVPLAASMMLGGVAVMAAPERSLPAYVAAEASITPRLTTLQIVPQATGGVRALLQRDLGATLDDQSTLAQTSLTVDASQEQLAELTGNLITTSGDDPLPILRELGAQFVLLSPVAEETAAADAIRESAGIALNQKVQLTLVGETGYGTLWRVNETVTPIGVPGGTHGWYGTIVLLAQLLVLGSTLLLAIPAGVGRETKPVRVKRREHHEPVVPEPEGDTVAGPSTAPSAPLGDRVLVSDADLPRSVSEADVPRSLSEAEGEVETQRDPGDPGLGVSTALPAVAALNDHDLGGGPSTAPAAPLGDRVSPRFPSGTSAASAVEGPLGDRQKLIETADAAGESPVPERSERSEHSRGTDPETFSDETGPQVLGIEFFEQAREDRDE